MLDTQSPVPHYFDLSRFPEQERILAGNILGEDQQGAFDLSSYQLICHGARRAAQRHSSAVLSVIKLLAKGIPPTSDGPPQRRQGGRRSVDPTAVTIKKEDSVTSQLIMHTCFDWHRYVSFPLTTFRLLLLLYQSWLCIALLLLF